jgi:hypothetical protein
LYSSGNVHLAPSLVWTSRRLEGEVSFSAFILAEEIILFSFLYQWGGGDQNILFVLISGSISLRVVDPKILLRILFSLKALLFVIDLHDVVVLRESAILIFMIDLTVVSVNTVITVISVIFVMS